MHEKLPRLRVEQQLAELKRKKELEQMEKFRKLKIRR